MTTSASATKNLLITGGAKGIGLMITRHLFHTNPHALLHIFVIQRSGEPSREHLRELLPEMIPGKHQITWIQSDLSSMDGIESAVKEIQSKTSTLNALVNNSGATWGEPLETYQEKGYDKVLNLNLKAPFFLTQKLLGLLKAGHEQSGEASRIVNIGSINGLQAPLLPTFAYSASKSALHMLTQHLARHLSPQITVNAVACGLFHTNMTKGTVKVMGADRMTRDIPMQRMGEQKDIGRVMDLFLGSDWITGAIVVLDGGVSLNSRF
mmetsp:Transcript_8176/g.30258  ORF Transcript_8176/g.30258 Transcript_8176/m.30258 type:complete len:266 (-) Transcript_8176:89-886(-)